MDYQEIQPKGILTSFIRYFWKYEHTKEDSDYIILPDACFDLLVDFEDGVLQDIILTRIWTKPVKVTVTKGTTLFAIRFKIIAAEYIFQKEIKSLLDTMVSLPTEFWNINLFKNSEFEEFVNKQSHNINQLLLQQRKTDERKLKLFDLIYSEEHFCVKELSEKVIWSSRQINRYFNQQYGFPLKTLLDIVRCHASYKDIKKGVLQPTKEYTDQAHFIKKIKQYTNHTPSQLSKNKNDRFLQLSVLSKK